MFTFLMSYMLPMHYSLFLVYTLVNHKDFVRFLVYSPVYSCTLYAEIFSFLRIKWFLNHTLKIWDSCSVFEASCICCNNHICALVPTFMLSKTTDIQLSTAAYTGKSYLPTKTWGYLACLSSIWLVIGMAAM